MDRLTVEETVEALLALARRMFAVIAERRKPIDDQPTRVQGHLLFQVRERRSMTMSEIAALLEVSPATATQLVAAMERKGWLERGLDPEDLRRHTVRLTPAGEERLRRLEARQRQALADVVAALSPEERGVFVELATRLVERALTLGSRGTADGGDKGARS